MREGIEVDDYQDHARNSAFNGVTARLRPGSTLKPFVYGAAFERGDTPATIGGCATDDFVRRPTRDARRYQGPRATAAQTVVTFIGVPICVSLFF
jgi:membrane carboxypeptidase/penicillin-binding protein PbpC